MSSQVNLPAGDNSFVLISSLKTSGNGDGFADAVTVWVNKPHVVKRNLCGSKLLFYRTVNKEDFYKSIGTQIYSTNFANVVNLLEGYLQVEIDDNADVEYEGESINGGNTIEIESLSGVVDSQIVIVVRDLLPKNRDKAPTTREFIIYDNVLRKLTVIPYSEDILDSAGKSNTSLQTDIGSIFHGTQSDTDVSYQFIFVQDDAESRIELFAKKQGCAIREDVVSRCGFIQDALLPKIVSWSGESQLKTSVTSLKLVQIDEYNVLYNHMKEKYGKKFVEIWPESTDPQKFVYEDVAIATYLLLLWKQERKDKGIEEKQSFVDLGCGNGLLVHILSAEGHPGVGLDVRRRNIWDLYGSGTCLKEETVTPSADNIYPDYDWLIGNHSDELTPWIPVMAARSSYQCRYFVLPCCHFDFDKKFNQKQQGVSNYRSYLNFVQEVGQVCGFNVEEDTLRIPSTKRVCFVGKSRTYFAENELRIDSERTSYIQKRCSSPESKTDNEHSHNDDDTGNEMAVKRAKLDHSGADQWSSNFKPRESVERTRNCQTIRRELIDFIVKTVFNHVLDADKVEVRELPNGRKWHKGGCVPLSKVVQLFDRDILKELKSECGGLQTLLRNNNSVFNVSGGNVQLRDLTLKDPYSGRSKLKNKDKSEYFKTIRCWFYDNHPDGCPRNSDTCTFAHGAEDLKHPKASMKNHEISNCDTDEVAILDNHVT